MHAQKLWTDAPIIAKFKLGLFESRPLGTLCVPQWNVKLKGLNKGFVVVKYNTDVAPKTSDHV